MDTIPTENLKNNIYGRSLREDLNLFYNDLNLRTTLTVFGRYKFIKNSQHLSDILTLNVESCANHLECLRNLGFLGLSDKGYFETGKSLYKQEKEFFEDKTTRAKQHAEKLIQIAGQYISCDEFSDVYTVFCASESKTLEFHKKFMSLINEFSEECKSTPRKEKDVILNLGLGFTYNKIKTPKGDQ